MACSIERRQTCMLRKVAEALEAPARPEAASPAVLRPSAEGRSAAGTRSEQTRVGLRVTRTWSEQLSRANHMNPMHMPLAPKAPGALCAPGKFRLHLFRFSPFNFGPTSCGAGVRPFLEGLPNIKVSNHCHQRAPNDARRRPTHAPGKSRLRRARAWNHALSQAA